MTRDMFIKTLQDNMVQFKADIDGDVYIDNAYILIGSTAYIFPNFLCNTKFQTLRDSCRLEKLNPSDLEPLMLHYRNLHPQKSTEECLKKVFADPAKPEKSIEGSLKEIFDGHIPPGAKIRYASTKEEIQKAMDDGYHLFYIDTDGGN